MSKLYTPRMLSLAAQLADFPLDDAFERRSEARSRTCGSTITIGLDLDHAGKVSRLGMLVSACAIGQGSASIMAADAAGRQAEDFERALSGIEHWLSGEGEIPDWPGIDALEPAREHPGRHGALLMPWQAAVAALSTARCSRATA